MGVKLQPSSSAAAAVYAMVYLSAGQVIPNVTFTTIAWDTVVQQSSGNPYDAAGTHAFTCPRAGRLRVLATLQVESAAYTELVLNVRKNAVEAVRGPQIALTIKAIWLAVMVPVALGDVVDVQGFHSSAASRTWGAGAAGAHCEFSLD